MITFVSHTSQPGGGELALRRYLSLTQLPARLVSMQPGGVWDGLGVEVVTAPTVLRLRAELRDAGIIVANSMRSAFLTALAAPRSAQVVYWVRDGLTHSAMSGLALTLTKQVTARRVDHYLANSTWTAGTIREALSPPPDRIDVVTSLCGVSTRASRPPRRAPHRPLRLLYLGRIAEWKAPDVAVAALTPLRAAGVEATLTLAGGALFGERRYADRLADMVAAEPGAQLVGHVDDVYGLLAAHDVLVHTSRRPEPFGQVLVQALAAGLPVVTTAGGGPTEILAGAPCELTYPGGEPEALAAAVTRVVARYEDVARWAWTRAGAYTDDELAVRTDTVLASL